MESVTTRIGRVVFMILVRERANNSPDHVIVRFLFAHIDQFTFSVYL